MRFPLLALLAGGPAHGYELKTQLERRVGSVLPPLNAGQIYTTLSRLQRDGLVDDDAVAQNGRPNKRVYRLTPAGQDALDRWVAGAAPRGGGRTRGPRGRGGRPAGSPASPPPARTSWTAGSRTRRRRRG